MMNSKRRRSKLKPQQELPPSPNIIKKKLRSELPRRKRTQFSPIILIISPSNSSLAQQSSSASFYGTEVSSKLNFGNRPFHFSNHHQKIGPSNAEVVSESSCVESNSGADFDRDRKFNNKIDSIQEIQYINGESCAESILESVCSFEENRALEFEFEYPRNNVDAVSRSESTIEQCPDSLKYESDLACTEQFSYEDVSEYSSELQSNIFSDTDFSDYTPSIFLQESGSEFSERSNNEDDATPSLTFSFLLQYRYEFSKSVSSQSKSSIQEERKDQSTFLRFDEFEDEESYQMLRNRERRQLIIRDYAKEYRSTTDFGDLILHQRSLMVHWIVELSKDMELQEETTFLGVSLLDQLLSRGFFKSGRNLEILGIASLTLATRIEENQPYNSVRRKNFHVGSNIYSRSEVVGMEWLIGEVLKFECFLPTVCNFLWFYLKAARADSDLENRAKQFAVLVLSHNIQFCYFPSTIAAALVILASLGGNQDAPRQRVIETHIRTKTDDLHECIESLEWLLRFL